MISLNALILKLFYSGVKLEESQTATIEQIEKDAIIIYATKFTNYFEFMFYYRRYQKLGLPFPQIGFEYRLLIWQPVSRLLKILLAHVDYFLRNFKFPDAYKSGYIKDELIDGRCGYLSMVGKKVFYRRFVEARKDPIQYLIETQQSIDRPIYIIPQLMFFTKKPHRTHSTLIDVLFENNTAVAFGGGFRSARCAPVLEGVVFRGNDSGHGGGMYDDGASTLIDCHFEDNTSGSGAAISLSGSDVQIQTTTFYGNSAEVYGGAILCSHFDASRMENCTFEEEKSW